MKESEHETQPSDTEEKQEAIRLDDYFGETGEQGAQVDRSDSQPFVGECVDEKHPHIAGRCRVEWTDSRDDSHSRWLPKLAHITVREGDRVLVQSVSNSTEPIITGVVDYLTPRSQEKKEKTTLELKSDEKISIINEKGEEIFAIAADDDGPVIQLVKGDINLNADGRFKISANSIELLANFGGVKISANDDVDVEGETINLN